MGRRRWWVAARGRRTLVVAAGLPLLAAGALALAPGGSGGGGGETAGTASFSTGAVKRRTLAERLTATGTIGYAGETTVLARLAGTVTALPAIGEMIRRGERLYSLDGEPVLLMYGAVPAYRALGEGVGEGEDVEQLERNLAALGHEPGAVDEEFTGATAAALAGWQEDVGLEASGELELGRVAFLRGPRRVTALEATLGEGLGAGAGGSSMVAWEPQGQEGVAGAEEADKAAEKPQAELKEPQPEEEPRHREVPKPDPEPEEPGPEPEPSSVPVLRTSSARRIVSIELEADQQSIAHRGQRVEVVLPSGAKVPGKVVRLTSVQPSAGEGEPGEEPRAGVKATISVTGGHRIPALDGATVNVLFTQRVRRHALSVPLSALIAIGGERFAVYVLEDGSRRRILVTPGLGADGYVEVEGRGLRPGMKVETGG